MPGDAAREERERASDWFGFSFQSPLRAEGRFPVRFRYGENESPSFLAGWRAEWLPATTREGAAQHTLLLTDPGTGLQCRCEVAVFEHFPALEWVAYFTNTGSQNTPIIADIKPLDTVFAAAKELSCQVHHSKGSDCRIDDFAPLETPLPPGAELRLAPLLGRSSNGTLPFFNLQMGEAGVVGAIGWTGAWAADFKRDDSGNVHVSAGMERTHLTLHPGETIRTPRILLIFWEGDRLRGHNLLRRFILAHHTPRPAGALLQAPVCHAVWGENTEQTQIAKARWWHDHGLPLDAFWIDAGWHGDAPFKEGSNVFNSQWWSQVGNWWPNPTTYPNGLRPVGEALEEMGLGFVLWLEPERVFKGTYFAREHPEWLLGPIGDNHLFNLGSPEARAALTDLVSNLIAESGITCYRQDFNTDPAPFWSVADAPDRVGISEIRHIEGLYAFWDDLLARHPGLIIDNCSSGGRRIDLETISRSIPLWRSDYQCFPNFDPIGIQGQTHGLSLWVPLSTGCCDRPQTYAYRSALGPGVVLGETPTTTDPKDVSGLPSTPPFPPDWIRQMLEEHRHVRKYFYGDFYPLVSFTLADDAWAAWQFDRPDLGEGMVLALRRPRSPFVQMKAPLHGLEPDTSYEVRSLDEGPACSASGRELMEDGLTVTINDMPGSALFVYRRAR